MATVGLATTNPTLLDLAKLTVDGKIIPVIQSLQQRNGFLQSMVWKEGNTDTGHMVASQNALPAVSWVRMNEGVLATKGTTDTYTETTGMLEGLSSVDRKLARLNGNAAAFRAQADDSFLASMANTLESAFFYESTKINPERILGLAARLGSTSGKYGNQIVLADPSPGSGTVSTSIYLIGWGDRSVYGITPRGMPTGLEMEDMGLQRDKDLVTGKIRWMLETSFAWKVGLCVEDYRNVVRIANINTSQLLITGPAPASGSDLVAAMVKAWYQIFDPRSTRLAWYCNRTVGAYLHMQALRGTNSSSLSVLPAPMTGSQGYAGAPITQCMGAPIYITDALLDNEAVVS
jgi:hypothetical protein